MIIYDPVIASQFAAGKTDAFDAVTFVFDSGVVSVFLGQGRFEWEDPQLGTMDLVGLGGLLSIEASAQVVGGEAAAVTVRLAETYYPAGATEPVNIFDDGVRASIDEEPWQGRAAILSRFHRSTETGLPVMREQLSVRMIDSMSIEEDDDGNPIRVILLEREDIIARDVEGKTENADFQKLIDPTDLAFQHAGTIRTQDISWGGLPPQKAG